LKASGPGRKSRAHDQALPSQRGDDRRLVGGDRFFPDPRGLLQRARLTA